MVHVELDRQAYAHDLEQHLQRTLFSGGIADPEGAILLIRGALADGDQPKAVTLAAATQQLATRSPSDTEMAAAAEHARGLVEQNPYVLDQAAERYSTERARACALEDAGHDQLSGTVIARNQTTLTVRAATWTQGNSRLTASTALKSPSEAIGKPASRISTPSSTSFPAMRSFSGTVMLQPGDCSPSRRVVSKIQTRLFIVGRYSIAIMCRSG